MITADQLLSIMPYAKQRVPDFLDPLNAAMTEYQIDTSLLRTQMFLAQVAHESGELRYVKELASGDAYEGRADLGNTQAGDGVHYKGRGLIQITGRANYQVCGDALGLPLIDSPELLEQPINATRSAAWFWQKHGLNEQADLNNFITITRRINGGVNGLADRQMYLARAQKAIV